MMGVVWAGGGRRLMVMAKYRFSLGVDLDVSADTFATTEIHASNQIHYLLTFFNTKDL